MKTEEEISAVLAKVKVASRTFDKTLGLTESVEGVFLLAVRESLGWVLGEGTEYSKPFNTCLGEILKHVEEFIHNSEHGQPG